MQMRYKSPNKLCAAKKKIDTVIYLRTGKTNTVKTPPGDVKVTTPENPLMFKFRVCFRGFVTE